MSVSYDIPFRNTSGETAPPFAVLELKTPDAISDNNGSPVVDIIKSTGENGSKLFIINGPVPVKADQFGMGTRHYAARALYEAEHLKQVNPGVQHQAIGGMSEDEGPIKIVGGRDAATKTVRVSLSGTGGGSSTKAVLVVAAFGGAIWDPAQETLRTSSVLAYNLDEDPDVPGTYIRGDQIFAESYFSAVVVMTTGWYLIGIVSGGILVNVDCQTVPGDTITISP